MEFIGPREAKKGISLKAGGLRKSKSKVKKEKKNRTQIGRAHV